jgi:hypothetical protein
MIQQWLKELNLQLGIHWLEGDILKINTLNMLFYAVWNIRWRRPASTSAMSTSDKSNLDWLQNLMMSPLDLPLLQLKLYMHRTLEETPNQGNNCQQGRGPFVACVRLSGYDYLTKSCCSNLNSRMQALQYMQRGSVLIRLSMTLRKRRRSTLIGARERMV